MHACQHNWAQHGNLFTRTCGLDSTRTSENCAHLVKQPAEINATSLSNHFLLQANSSLDVTVQLIALYRPLLLSYSVLYDTVFSLSQHLGTCEWEGDVAVVAPLGGVAQVVSHGVKVVGVHGEEGQEKDGEAQVEVKGEVEENQGQPHMDGMWMKVKDSRTT